MEGTDKGQENGEAMALVSVRLTDQLGAYLSRIPTCRVYLPSFHLTSDDKIFDMQSRLVPQ